MTPDNDEPKRRPAIRPELKDKYRCNDCGCEWIGDEMDCPSCNSTNTGLVMPEPNEVN